MLPKMLSLLLALTMLQNLAACGADDPAPEDQAPPGAVEVEPEAEPEPEPEPIVIPDPVSYKGTGDDVLEIQPLDGPWMMHITGNSAGRHFAVTGYDDSGEYTDTFVNTTEIYDGYVYDDTQSTTAMEIKANGDWTVELVSVYTAPHISADAPLSGNGDAALLIDPPNALWTFHIFGNSGDGHFAVKGYDNNGNYTDLFVNTSDPYDGITMDISQSTFLLIITSESEWTVELPYVRDLPQANQGDTITGSGDSVIHVDQVGDTADISGNEAGAHFAVKAYSFTDGDLLVNTSDPYNGTVMLDFDPLVMLITAEGPWSVTFN